jgi:hypothetical protein
MKPSLIAISVAALAFLGCASVMKTTAPPPGRMNDASSIGPCHGDRRDAQACGDAIFNESVIAQIHTGQTLSDVRAIMRHEAERRAVDGSNESWGYVTDYNDKVMVMTWIGFTDWKVSSVTRQLRVRI